MITKIFEPILGKTMDAYIDDMVVKSIRKVDHIMDLTKVFTILKRHKLRLKRGKMRIQGELKKILGTLGDKTRDRGNSKINYNDQQPH